MVKIRNKIEARSIVGNQGNTLRISIPQEISKYIKVNSGDVAKWVLYPTTEKPEIKIEILEAENK